MSKYRQIGMRVTISVSVGILVAAIAVIVAWRNMRSMIAVRPEQMATGQGIGEIEDLVHAYHAGMKVLPKSLEEVRGASSLSTSSSCQQMSFSQIIGRAACRRFSLDHNRFRSCWMGSEPIAASSFPNSRSIAQSSRRTTISSRSWLSCGRSSLWVVPLSMPATRDLRSGL